MLPAIKYSLTNWKDGMKIHKQHFVDSENALIDAVRDTHAAHVTAFSFGLLTPVPGEKRSIDVKLERTQSDNFKITLNLCRAITAGGVRIEVLPETMGEINCEERIELNNSAGSGKPGAYLVILTVDPFNRQEAGAPDASEHPVRNPYSEFRYTIHAVAENNIAVEDFGAFHFPVARLEARLNDLVVDNNYIPPCASIKAHPAMVQLYNLLGANFNQIQEHSTTIVQKVISKAQNTPLAQNVRKLCQQSVQHVSSVFFAYRNIMPHQPPVYIAEAMVQLANLLKVELDFMPEKEKEEMLQYFKEWNEVSPSAFEDMLGSAIELDYDHYHIYTSFMPLVHFSNRWKELLEKLAELELIGRRKQGGIVVGEVYKEKKKGFFLE